MHPSSRLIMICVVATVIIASCFIPTSSLQCTTISFSRYLNKKLVCGIFKTFSASTEECLEQCTAAMKCFSTNVYKSWNGTEMCEFVNGTKESFGEESECMITKRSVEHHEPLSIGSCFSPWCSSGIRKALPDGWYQFGSFAFKLFNIVKTRKDANITCSVNQAALASINTEQENRFVGEVLLAAVKEVKLEDTSLQPFKHWTLDKPNGDIVLYSGATYDQKSLTLPGTAGSYATSPAFAIQSTSFTLAFWIKVESCLNRNYYVYSHWLGPYLFAYAIRWNSGKCIFSFQARGATVCVSGCDLLSVSGGDVTDNKWAHTAVTWDRASKKVNLYQDGVVISQKTVTAGDINLQSPGRSVFDIGYKRDSGTVIKATLTDLVVFTRALTQDEVGQLRDTTRVKKLGAWIDPQSSYSNWVPNPSSSSNCVVMDAKLNQWDKIDCNDVHAFVCKKKIE